MPICIQCQRSFTPKHKDAKFCSKKCANENWRQRHPNYKNFHSETEEQKAKKREFMKDYRIKHPEIVRANKSAYRDLPIADCCEICGSTENLQRHHPDYSLPDVVLTICSSCHKRIHDELQKQKNAEEEIAKLTKQLEKVAWYCEDCDEWHPKGMICAVHEVRKVRDGDP